MSKSERTRKIVALSAGAAVGLSATAMVLLQAPNASSEGVKFVQSALRDGVSTAKVNLDKSSWIQLAKPLKKSDDP